MRAGLDAVTIDAYGTLVTLGDPIGALAEALERRGAGVAREQVAEAFAAEVAYYRPRSHEGRDAGTLAELRRECTRVFLEAAGADTISPRDFAADFVGALRFELLPGALEACEALENAGLRVGVVSNWDIGLHEHLERLGLDGLLSTVVTSAEAGAPKPDPAVFRLALARLGVSAERAVHVGDSDADEFGARAAGMRYRPAPLADAIKDLA
ncbi:MAG TPA: HAD-IA family hydrolase [Gaiellaceae bacterium]